MRFKLGAGMALLRSRTAAAAAFAAILAGPGALANELQEINVVSNPGSDQTYSSDGEDNTIVFRTRWSGRVSVRGTDLVFIVGDEERQAFCPQTGDCDTCPVFEFECSYVVQPGDLDEDGISIPAGVPFTGSVTRGDSNINQANCTPGHESANPGACDYAGLPAQAGHKVDGGPAEGDETGDGDGTGDTGDGDEVTDEEPAEPVGEPMIMLGGGPADDDHGSQLETSTLLSIGPPLTGTLDGDSDVDVFRLDLAGNAAVEVRTGGQTDTRGELLDGNGDLVAADDNSGPGGHNFLVEEDLQAGIYYVVVTGAAGDYSIGARLTAELDQGAVEAAAALLTLYDRADFANVSSRWLLATSAQIAPSTADVDVFRIDVPHDATDVRVETSGGTVTPLHARLVDDAMTELGADDRNADIRIDMTLDAGTYYVIVGGHDAGKYRVLASAVTTGCPCAMDMTVGDDGGTAESSTLLQVGGAPLARSLDDADMDVFRMDLAGNATVEVRAGGQTDTRGELLDASGAAIASDDDSGPGGHNFRIEEALQAGIYYVVVTGAEAGDYSISARLSDALDQGGAEATSALLTLYDRADFDQVSSRWALATSARIWPDTDDVDAFRLDVAGDGTEVRLETSGGTATPLTASLVDGALDVLETVDEGGDVRIDTTLDAGAYYLLVSGGETGNYRVLASRASPPCDCAGEGE